MISSSVLPDFGWPIAAPLSDPSSSMPAPQVANADSFQDIFANAAALPEFAPSPGAMADPSRLESNTTSNWTPPAIVAWDAPATDATATQEASPVDADSEPASASEPTSDSKAANDNGPAASDKAPTGVRAYVGDSKPINISGPASGSTPSVSLASNSVSSDSPKTNDQSQTRSSLANTKTLPTAAKLEKKVDQRGLSRHAEPSGGTLSGAPASVGAMYGRVVSEGAARNRATGQAAAPDCTPAVQRDGFSADLTEKTGLQETASAGGLSGTAFALHITPAGNRSNAAQSTAAPGPAARVAAQPLSAGVASPTNAAVPDPAVLSPGSTDPAGLLVGGTAPLASPGGARSRQVSALGSSLASAGATPWSGSVFSPALLNNQAKSAQPASAAAPVVEIDAEDASGTAQPVRTLQLQLGGTGDQRVDLRLVETAGGLSVSVRASDSTLTRGLQDNLPELSARLAAEQYQTQAWLPAASQTSAGGASSGSSEQQPEQRGDGQFSQGGSSSSGGGNQPQDRQQDQAPPWWRQLAALNGAPAYLSTSSVQSSTPKSTTSEVTKQ